MAETKRTANKTKASSEKKTGTKRAAAKTVAEPVQEPKKIPTTINLQAYGKSISGDELIEMAKQQWVDTGHDLESILSLDIYIKTEDSRVYYVVNQTETGTFFLYS